MITTLLPEGFYNVTIESIELVQSRLRPLHYYNRLLLKDIESGMELVYIYTGLQEKDFEKVFKDKLEGNETGLIGRCGIVEVTIDEYQSRKFNRVWLNKR